MRNTLGTTSERDLGLRDDSGAPLRRRSGSWLPLTRVRERCDKLWTNGFPVTCRTFIIWRWIQPLFNGWGS